MIAVDTAPSGLLMVAGLNPANRTLLERYNPLVRKYRDMNINGREGSILGRTGARTPDDPAIASLLQALKAERERPPQPGFALRLKRVLGM
jgi:hypothetical protein